MPLRYLLAFRSNMVYLSLGSIWASVGISAFHRSNDLSVSPFLASALLSVSTTLSTARNRLRCRNFCVGERRQGIFLRRRQPIASPHRAPRMHNDWFGSVSP